MTRRTIRTLLTPSLVILVTTGLLFGIAAVETAGESTSAKIPPWAQFGEVTIHTTLPNKTEPVVIRFVAFENWDFLVELDAPSSIKKTLQLASSATSLYSGLTEIELSSPEKNPFIFFDMALAPILGPLIAVFPKGIDQLPYAETSFSTVWEKREFHGVVERTSSDMVRYDITMGDTGSGQSFGFYGTWQGTKASPLPDNFSLHGWQVQAARAGETMQPFATLGELRKKQGSTPLNR